MGRIPIIVIADDLSGAAELAGIAFSRGLSAEVQRQFDLTSQAGVIAVDTDSRSLSAAEAARRVEDIVLQSIHLRPIYFKKVDSVLRGNPRAEIEALLRATGRSSALLIPANPSRGRVIQKGQYLIDGVPLDQTALANEVEHSRPTADVRTLLGRGQYSVHFVSASEPLPAAGIVVPDVSSQAELDAYVRVELAHRLLAGAADCFTSLLPHRNPPETTPHVDGPALLVCGSRTSWPIRSSQCQAAGVPIATIFDRGLPAADASVLMLGIGERVSGMTQSEMLNELAEFAVDRIDAASITTLLLEGGATATAIAQRLGWTRFEVVATAPAGVGVLRPLARVAPLVLVKPGSYSWPPEIWRAFCKCAAGR